ncbi:MAG: CapA family protein [Chloroflexi bacterium]|nr:CapA family protein [Chloroflexota bacterium]
MSVRDPKVRVRRQAVPRQSPGPAPGGPRQGVSVSQILVGLLFALLLLGTGAFVLGALNAQPSRPPLASDTAGRPSAGAGSPLASPDAGASSDPDPNASASPGDPSASPDPGTSPDASTSPDPGTSPDASGPPPASTPPGTVEVAMPIVPVVGFWEMDPGLSRAELIAALEGDTERYETVLVPPADRAAIETALGVNMGPSVRDAEPEEIRTAVKDGALGLLRAADVTTRVRALALEDRELFGNERVRSNLDWPLVIPVAEPPERAWDQSSTVTIVAGGDSMMDRGIYERVVNRDLGVDYPLDGGTVEITGRYCCGPFVGGYEVPSFRKTGNEGLVRAKLVDADLAMINLENPTPDNWVFHLHGTPFSGKPELLEIFKGGGIDWMSLANNHIYDFGPSGVEDTLKHLRRFDFEFAGAGMNLEEARRYPILRAGASRVAILPCVTITPIVWAQADRAGAMPCNDEEMIPNIERAAEEADIVIVFPSWGPEYTPFPLNSQRRFAAQWVEAGADVVVGFGHHMVAGMEEIDERLVFYSIGNFVFDQNWAEFTMEGILPEMTFQGGELVQVRLNPFLTLDQAQPNLLDPAGDGRVIFREIRRGSEGLDFDY